MTMTRGVPRIFGNPRKWTVNGTVPDPEIWRRIELYHIAPLLELWRETGIVLMPSRGSCYRPISWELMRKRSGNSLHCFPGSSKGAIDLVREDGFDIVTILDHLALFSPWRRICYYQNHSFVHADYGDRSGVEVIRRQLFVCDDDRSSWVFKSWLPETRL